MFPSDPRHYSRKRKLFQVGNTSTDPFGLNADALNNFKNTLDRPVKSFTSLLLDGVYDDDEDEDEYSEEDKKKELRKGQVMPFDRVSLLVSLLNAILQRLLNFDEYKE